MKESYSLFSYQNGSSFLHKIPGWIKFLFVPILNIFCLVLPIQFTFLLIIFQFLIAIFYKISILRDLKPVFFYLLIVFFMQIFMCFFNGFNFKETFTFENQKENIYLLLKILCIMQTSSLIFKTSTSLELREGIYKIESFVRKFFHLKQKSTFTDLILFFLNFIPIVSKIWEQTKTAYFARGGKKSVVMIFKLIMVLFSVGIQKAYNMSRALEIRK